MYLTKLEVHGFKTFAKKTVLSFLPSTDKHFPLTAIVGPNGSGKSNLSDAVRWVLGEQSLKLLRGKKTEDVIFSGSDGRSRAGVAEVSLTFNNEDHSMPLDYAEVTLTRRLYRDGTSEYVLNEGMVRLADIQLLLAEANVGQRSYSVIGQGMIDQVLISTPEERKHFFDDATGVRSLQIKRHEALLKLTKTEENLYQVEMMTAEIEPRLRSLKRQTSRLEKREALEQELKVHERQYYSFLWWTLADQIDQGKSGLEKLQTKIAEQQSVVSSLEERMDELEKTTPLKDASWTALQKQLRELHERAQKIKDQRYTVEREMELQKIRAESTWAPLPLSQIISEIKGWTTQLTSLIKSQGSAWTKDIQGLIERAAQLLQRLERPSPKQMLNDPSLEQKRLALQKKEQHVKQEEETCARECEQWMKGQTETHHELIQTQRQVREQQHLLQQWEHERNSKEIECARLDERARALSREMDEWMKEEGTHLRGTGFQTVHQNEQSYENIQRLRAQLERIGGIDPEVIREYEETRIRFEFLETQLKDLTHGIHVTEKMIKELDERIEKQSEHIFKKIQKEFQRYFKILFGGGTCALVKLTQAEADLDDSTHLRQGFGGHATSPFEHVSAERGFDKPEEWNEAGEMSKRADHRVVGIDIQATPPGKRLKALNLLSGGERALTSLALVSAIMSVNPAPFVILDEVDAALDESNTMHFAAILDELSTKSQFIIITHNRATMEKANILYGVTMGTDGISNVLSVHLEDHTIA